MRFFCTPALKSAARPLAVVIVFAGRVDLPARAPLSQTIPLSP